MTKCCLLFPCQIRDLMHIKSWLPSLFLSVHIQTFDGGSVPHVSPTSTFCSICGITTHKLNIKLVL